MVRPNMKNPRCPICNGISRKHGISRYTHKISRRYHCSQCGRTFGIPKTKVSKPLVILDQIESED